MVMLQYGHVRNFTWFEKCVCLWRASPNIYIIRVSFLHKGDQHCVYFKFIGLVKTPVRICIDIEVQIRVGVGVCCISTEL